MGNVARPAAAIHVPPGKDVPLTVHEGLIEGAVDIAQGPLRLVYRFVCYGWDLEQFAAQMELQQTSLQGDATFLCHDGSVGVWLSVADRGRGRIAVRVRLEQVGVSAVTEDVLVGGLELTGFGIDQSYLPVMIEQIRDFLGSNGILTAHPMEQR